MADSPYQELRFGFESARLRLGSASLSPLLSSPSTRRLSIGSAERPSRRGRNNAPAAAARQLSWMSLQGWLADADEATSARAIKGGLEPEQAVAWELFTPIQRILFVAVISVAAAESKKNRLISQLKKSVEFRDQVLSNMQQKLDSLCAQISNIKDDSGTVTPVMSPMKNIELQSNEEFGCAKIKFVDCGCWLCDQHRDLSDGLVGNNDMKGSNGYEMLQYKMSLEHVVAEQEERRMSDLSDMASSVTSAADFQLNSLAIEQDMHNLRRDCQEKDGTIRELTSLLHSSETAGSKRIAELEDVIRRKNSIITRLKRDMAVLEQKVVHHARLRRSSYSSSSSDDADFADPLPKVPHMADNLLYDMDSTTSPSSSNSDSSSPVNRACAPVSRTPEIAKTLETSSQTFESASIGQKSVSEKVSISMVEQPSSRRTSVSPLKEITMNSRHLRSVSTKSRPVSPRWQPLSPRSQPASPLSPFSKRPQPASPSSRPASPLSPLPKKSQPASSIKKSSTSQTSRPRQLSASGDSKMSKRRSLPQRKESKDATPHKRWA